jgi:hypothetical protein
MLRDWIYNHPTWEMGSTIVALSVVASWIGLFVFDRFVPVSVRSRHNDVAGFIIAIIGVVYAVLLAFIAVAAWASFDSANTVVQTEANLIDNLYRDSVALDQPLRGEVRHHLKKYVEHVVEHEWPAQRLGESDPHGWLALQRLHRAIISIDAKNLGQSVVEGEMLRTLNRLYSARRTRILAAADGIPDTIWWILVLGGVMTVAFSFFFGMPSMRMHYAMTGLLAASMALVMVLIISLDWPFRGEVSISPEAYLAVQESMNHPAKANAEEPDVEAHPDVEPLQK